MALDIGIISVTYLDHPSGRAYDFAMEMAQGAVWDGYMHGIGNSWGVFSKDEVMEMVEEFSLERGLSVQERTGVMEWVESLPWNDGSLDFHFSW